MQWLYDLIVQFGQALINVYDVLFTQFWSLFADVLKLPAALAYKMILGLWEPAQRLMDPLARALIDNFVEKVSAMMADVPVPDALANFNSQWAAVPWSQMAFWLEPFQVPYGLTVITGAQISKFTLRWVPYLGRAFMAPSN
jgi:hypothetical protein